MEKEIKYCKLCKSELLIECKNIEHLVCWRFCPKEKCEFHQVMQ